MNTIGTKVKAIRTQHKLLNQVAFSEAIGILQGRLNEIEQYKTKTSAKTLKEMWNKFSIDLNWLLDDTNENRNVE